jgi:hypothetical protein
MGNVMKNAVSGLCSTCIHEPGCVYLEPFRGTVIQCEEFEIYHNKPMTGNSKNSNNPNNLMDEDLFAGLCKNCDFRVTCKQWVKDTIIWHCEEYQ